jgi:AcrR family transcriptional regulator
MLDAAVAVFSRRGYHATSVDEIAEVAGISKPMVYAYLGTKEELFIACLHREGARLMEAIAGAVHAMGRSAPGPGPPGPLGSPGPADQVSCCLHAFLRFVAAHRDGWAVLYRQARGQEPFAEVLGQLRARMTEITIGALARVGAGDGSQVTGARVAGPQVQALGYALVGAAEAVADWLADQPAVDPDEVADGLMNAVWLGVEATVRGAVWRPAPRC